MTTPAPMLTISSTVPVNSSHCANVRDYSAFTLLTKQPARSLPNLFRRSGLRAAGPARQIKNRLVYKEGRRKATADRDRPYPGAVESPSRSVVHGVSR